MMTTTMTMISGSVIDGPNNNTIVDDDDAAVTLTDGSGPRLLVGNTPIAVRQPFDGVPELMLLGLPKWMLLGLPELMLDFASLRGRHRFGGRLLFGSRSMSLTR